MPLVGTICCQTGQPQDFDYCLGCARTGSPKTCVHPLPLIKFMAGKEDSRKGIGLSATGIIACARQNVLLNEHDYYESPDRFMAAFRGEIWHDAFEKWLRDEPNITSEVRLQKDVEVGLAELTLTITLTGKPDEVHRERGLIVDTKTVARPVVCDKENLTEKQYMYCENRRIKVAYPEHEQQINVYAWMHRNGREFGSGESVNVRITHGGIVYVGEGGRASRKLPVRIWTDDEQDAFVAERVLPRARYDLDGTLPPVLPVEKIIKARNTGKRYVKRHWKCGYCPVRALCDELATRERGVSPNEPEYWTVEPEDTGRDQHGTAVDPGATDGVDSP